MKKLAIKFLKEVKRLETTLETLTGIQRDRKIYGDIWPFGGSCKCLEKDCYKRKDGLWQKYQRLSTHAKNDKGGYGYDVVFLWRIKPNGNCYGRPYFTIEQYEAFLNESETEKILISEDGYEFVWKWENIKPPTEIVWGMDMGPTFFQLRKNGEVLINSLTKADFLRQVEKLEQEKK
jgi:hypothetical protein